MRRLHLLPAFIPVLLAAAIVPTLEGCGSKSSVEARTTTTGKELEDLDAAREKGLISESEYNKQRKRILKGN